MNPAFNLLKNTDLVSLTLESRCSGQDQKQKEVRCQNGSSECFMKCSISAYPEPKDYLQIIGCSFQNLLAGGKPVEQAEKVFATCALKHDFDFHPIDECYNREKKIRNVC